MSPDLLERDLRRALAAEPVIEPGPRERARLGALAAARAASETGRRRSPHRRTLAIGLGALLLAGGVAFGAATLITGPPPLRPDTSRPMFAAVVDGHQLMVAPTQNPAVACFINREPSGVTTTVCDGRSRILSIGSGSITSNSRSRLAVAVGFAPRVTAVRLGSATVRTTAVGFYVVRGPKDATLTFYRGHDVVRAFAPPARR